MKRPWFITCIICILLLGGGWAALHSLQIVPPGKSSDIYRKYAEKEGIDATFIKDYRVNDSTRVSVTLLEAKTDSAWAALQSDLNARKAHEEHREKQAHSTPVTFWLAPKGNPTGQMDSAESGNDLFVMSEQKQTISICHIENDEQLYAIIFKEIHELKNQKSIKQ